MRLIRLVSLATGSIGDLQTGGSVTLGQTKINLSALDCFRTKATLERGDSTIKAELRHRLSVDCCCKPCQCTYLVAIDRGTDHQQCDENWPRCGNCKKFNQECTRPHRYTHLSEGASELTDRSEGLPTRPFTADLSTPSCTPGVRPHSTICYTSRTSTWPSRISRQYFYTASSPAVRTYASPEWI